MTSKLVKCTCINETQDELYGKGNRMANEMRSGQLRCTVCSTVHGSQSATTQTEKVAAKVAAKETAKVTRKMTKKEANKNEKKRKGSLKGTKR